MIENYLEGTAVQPNGRKARTVTHQQTNNLPAWVNLQTLISIVTLVGMIVGFFVQNAIQNERADRLKVDFESFKSNTSDRLDKLSGQNEEIKIYIAHQEGAKEAQEKRK